MLIPVLWFVPEYWGSGHFFRGVTRAHTPRSNSAAFASFPFWSELSKHAWPTVPSRIKLVAIVGIAISVFTLWRANRARGISSLRGFRLVGTREHALAAMAIYGVLGFGWWILISIMTQAGFSGNDRYLVLGASMIEIAGGVTFGWAAYELGRARRDGCRRRGDGSAGDRLVGSRVGRGRVRARALVDRRAGAHLSARIARSTTRRCCARTRARRSTASAAPSKVHVVRDA